MLKRPPDSPYMEDDGCGPNLLYDLRTGDILMESDTWWKQRGMYKRYPRPDENISVCTNGASVGTVSRGGSVAVNCDDVSKDVGAVLVGYRRARIKDPNLLRSNVDKALLNLKDHIYAALEGFFVSNNFPDFFSGRCGIRVVFPRDKFQGIGLDNLYESLPDLSDIYDMRSNPLSEDRSYQQYLDSPRIEWLMALLFRLEEYIRNYVDVHVSVISCYSHQIGSEVNFKDIYLSNMKTAWDYDPVFRNNGDGLVFRAYFSISHAGNFRLRGLQFQA